MDPRLAQMKEIFKILQDSITKKEFVEAFEVLRKKVDAMKAGTDTDVARMKEEVAALSAKLKADNSADAAEMRTMCEKMLGQWSAKIEAKVMAMDEKMDAADEKMESLKDGDDAKPEDVAPLVVPLVLAALPPDVEETGDEIIAKINKADNLISKDAIEGMDELEAALNEKTKNTVRIGWGAHPITVYHNNTVIDKNTRVLNFASNLTVSRNANGVVTVSATGGGSGGITELTATGTINSSNTAFTFVSKPSYIYVDGTKYRENEGWTWSGLTATVTKAPDYSIWGEA